MCKPKVSVIIPVYKVEDWIERALHSLFGQTLDSIEYIFVDDASPDASMAILEQVLSKYSHRKKQVKIIRHSENRGVAAARTTGILAATGEYMIHCDPDDYIETTMYEEMYDKAHSENLDIVMCDYILHQGGKTVTVNLKSETTPNRLLANLYKPLRTPGYLVIEMVKSKLILENDILPFKQANYAEDLGMTTRILYHGKTISHINKPFYHYDKRETSITSSSSKSREIWEMRKIVIDGIFKLIGQDKRFKKTCDKIKLYTKLEYRGAFKDSTKEWFDIYRESHRHIWIIKMPWQQKILWIIMLQNYCCYRMGSKIYSLLTFKKF